VKSAVEVFSGVCASSNSASQLSKLNLLRLKTAYVIAPVYNVTFGGDALLISQLQLTIQENPLVNMAPERRRVQFRVEDMERTQPNVPFGQSSAPSRSGSCASRWRAEAMTAHGVPERVMTDQGSNFLSRTIDDLYRQFGIERLRTTTYSPCCDLKI
jgi:hypothetical protein